MCALGERTPGAASPDPGGLAAAGGKPGSKGGTIFQEEQQQHRLGLSLLPAAAFEVVLLGHFPLPGALPRNKVSVPLALTEEPLPSADPSGAAIPLPSLLTLQRPSVMKSGALSQGQPTSSIYDKGTDKQAFNSNTVSLQNRDYIRWPT